MGEDASESEAPITGSALEQAEAAALAETGQGTVTGTEVGDEESKYEVEVTLDNGDERDVQLDERPSAFPASVGSSPLDEDDQRRDRANEQKRPSQIRPGTGGDQLDGD
ncbi:MAG: hypothetical protein H0V85_06460 [Thermoleophilaceae bacterium]|nr:hypothetical protein [Thermoleophilaceae bacterium]